ncbi:NAD kinase [Sphingobacterium alkalisoli]|uniref:NAD kinase n=1 Tax=Sphingobacterium alkalisoli TaxID=1874115 RepID=UPI0019991BA2|nr:NAD kinase [Sphingobacterium alkalisoli]GGH26302.1 NAD kinase [Sphingobacterium alkalisoli]
MNSIAIAIYGRAFNTSVNTFVEELFTFLTEKEIDIYVYDEFYTFLKAHVSCPSDLKTFTSYTDLPTHITFMLSLGGDGTMLSAVSIIKDTGIPIVGVNFGRLGFLANIQKTEIKEALHKILNGEYTIQSRTLLTVETEGRDLFGGENFALNDITVFRFDTSSMITVNTSINGELLNSYWADGLIIATPTGSTAYSLSCGGPIIMPGSGNFVITPISPHNLNVRPIVVSSDMELHLQIESRTENFILSCDSRSETLPISTHLTIKKAPFGINLIRLEKDAYFSTLREKLLWGIDVRNY